MPHTIELASVGSYVSPHTDLKESEALKRYIPDNKLLLPKEEQTNREIKLC